MIEERILLFNENNEMVKILIKSDEKLGILITLIKEIEVGINTNYYRALIRNIIGQQLSVKAANTIWQRFFCSCVKR